jgi:hypothetical protein
MLMFKISLGVQIVLQSKSPLATAMPNARAGFMDAPAYPWAIPEVETETMPTAIPTNSGPTCGPKTACCRGSSPMPIARKLHVKVNM